LDDYLSDLLGASPVIRFRRVHSLEVLTKTLIDADGIVMLGHLYTADVAAMVREKGRHLRWIQLTTASSLPMSFCCRDPGYEGGRIVVFDR
jgi:hypothetical protein